LRPPPPPPAKPLPGRDRNTPALPNAGDNGTATAALAGTGDGRIFDLASAMALLPSLAAQACAAGEAGVWARVPDVLRRLVAAVDCVRHGTSPRRHVGFLAPSGAFAAERAAGGWVMAASSCHRYDRLVEVFCLLDAEACGAGFLRLEPALDLAYQELGYGEGRFRDALAGALSRLCRVPVPTSPIPLVRRGDCFLFADPRLEGLDEAQKHLLRAGPDNTRRFQEQARRLAAAAAIPLQP
ncbi:MAG: DUF3014 domain-containing protein, partial [Lentisphaeria bacterium]|nr:DUF3014 domain-containing protein [Lentisphaeria bacterium]